MFGLCFSFLLLLRRRGFAKCVDTTKKSKQNNKKKDVYQGLEVSGAVFGCLTGEMPCLSVCTVWTVDVLDALRLAPPLELFKLKPENLFPNVPRSCFL